MTTSIITSGPSLLRRTTQRRIVPYLSILTRWRSGASGRKATHFPGSSLLVQDSLNSPPIVAPQTIRYFSSAPPPDETDFTKLRRLEDANPERIHGIQVNPDGIGNTILPGNLVYKHYKWTGNTRKVPLELVNGYFWTLSDLKKTGGKPTLSNQTLIPEDEAQTFPMLPGLETLSRIKTDIPHFFIANEDAKCTLVNISFRESGYRNIDSWTKPFKEAFEDDTSFATVTVSITERWSLYMLQGALTTMMRKNTPASEHKNTLLYFGSDVDEFRDVLRMHNIMTNFVFLLDDLGRIRFAGSGPATDEDISRAIRFAKAVSKETEGNGHASKTKKNSSHRRRG